MKNYWNSSFSGRSLLTLFWRATRYYDTIFLVELMCECRWWKRKGYCVWYVTAKTHGLKNVYSFRSVIVRPLCRREKSIRKTKISKLGSICEIFTCIPPASRRIDTRNWNLVFISVTMEISMGTWKELCRSWQVIVQNFWEIFCKKCLVKNSR